jgi:hypothetical protein
MADEWGADCAEFRAKQQALDVRYLPMGGAFASRSMGARCRHLLARRGLSLTSLSYIGYRLKRRYGCQHDPSRVVADILEGDFHTPHTQAAVEWCRRCGAYRRLFDVYGQKPRYGEWRISSRWWDR